jgi:hypothetical protein
MRRWVGFGLETARRRDWVHAECQVPFFYFFTVCVCTCVCVCVCVLVGRLLSCGLIIYSTIFQLFHPTNQSLSFFWRQK